MTSTSAAPLYARVCRELARFRHRPYVALRFRHGLEDAFEAETREQRSRRMSRDGLLIAIAFPAILLADRCALPGRFLLAVLVRGAVCLPWLLLCRRFLQRNPVKFQREISVVLTAGLIACSSFLLYWRASEAAISSMEAGLLIALLITNVIMRLRFAYAAASTLFYVVSNFLFLRFSTHMLTDNGLSMFVRVSWGSLFVLLATYSLEREERTSYLLHLQTELQGEQLTELNAELARRSSHDSLTGLANRASFDRRLEELWADACAHNQPLSAVLIDIDHFKVVNDTQGHLYGDQVIQRVATLVLQSLRGHDDFAARYGGEEFIVLLPGTDQDAASLIAERIRSLVQLAGSPAPQQYMPAPGLWTTVSCGIATVEHARQQSTRSFIHAADQALYAAKSAGRNCVRAASLPTPPLYASAGLQRARSASQHAADLAS